MARGPKNHEAYGLEEKVPSPGRVRVMGPLSQDEVAKLFGVSRQAIKRAENRALRKLRNWHGLDLSGLLNDGKSTAEPDSNHVRNAA
jgi:hypothetical protein